MSFGNFIRSVRKERKLDILGLAKRSGVEASTISRVENARTQVTLLTAIRLCEGLEVTIADVLTALLGKQYSSKQQSQALEALAVPTFRDAEQFLTYFHSNKEEGLDWLADLLNKVVSMNIHFQGGTNDHAFHFFVPEDIHKLLFDSQVYRFEIQYPPAMSASHILAIHQHAGLLSLAEISEFVRKVRREKQMTIARLEQVTKLSQGTLARFESTVVEHIKLADVLVLDKQLEQEGTLLSMYWEAYRFYERSVRRLGTMADQDMKLVSIFITICRWLQFMNPQDSTWARNLPFHERLV
jgi:transcriptional regulator with XRE-family HTH domain